MFDVGFWEISLIAIVALVVVGPERLPSLVNEAGKWAGRARGTIRDLKYDLQRQAEFDQLSDLGNDLAKTKEQMNPSGLKKNLKDLIDDYDPDKLVDPIDDTSTDIEEKRDRVS